MAAMTSPTAAAGTPAVPTDLHTGGLGGHPRGLTTLFLAEMWERFSFYGMRAILMLFMVLAVSEGGLGYDTKKAAGIYGTYTMSGYLLCILGGFIADNFIGARRSVLIGGIIIALGHFTMAFNSEMTFFVGLALVAAGTGLLKPNISTMVGSLYRPEDERRDAGFSIFYMGINIGAFLSPLVCGYPRSSWHWGFAAAGVGMTLGLIVYVLQRGRLAHVGNKPAPEADGSRPWGKLGLVLLGSLALITAMWFSDTYKWIVYLLFGLQIALILFFAFRPSQESKRIAAILVFFFAAEIFWAIFEQTGSSISLFADRLTRNEILGNPFPSSWWQSVNSIWVIVLAPIFAWLWIKMGPKQPSSPMKFTLGLLCVALSFVWMVPAAKLTAEGLVSPMWLLALFFLQTVGEMLLSPVGLSTMTKLAPARLLGLVMGIWFLAAALGNKLAGVLAGEFKSENPAELATFFWHQALWVGAATLVLFALVPWVKRLMGGIR
jgi:POT family proton-dependent oligopeptide transporter